MGAVNFGLTSLVFPSFRQDFQVEPQVITARRSTHLPWLGDPLAAWLVARPLTASGPAAAGSAGSGLPQRHDQELLGWR